MDLTGQTVVNETDITGLTCDSRQVEPGFLFVALPGARLDGRDYTPDALGRGDGFADIGPVRSNRSSPMGTLRAGGYRARAAESARDDLVGRGDGVGGL